MEEVEGWSRGGGVIIIIRQNRRLRSSVGDNYKSGWVGISKDTPSI